MKTLLLLQIEFDGRAEVPLTEICESYLSMGKKRAETLAKVQKLPFPVHRLGTQRSPWMVNLIDLAAYIDEKRDEARREWEQMNVT